MSRLVTTAALLIGSLAGAQQRPDLSGEWAAADDRATSVAATGDASFRRGDMGSGWGQTIRIVQRADSLILTYVFFSTYDLQPPLRFAYALDGSESRNEVMIGHATSQQRSKVSWDGSTLVITTAYAAPRPAEGATASEVRRTLTLESPTSLVVETTRTGAQGTPITTRTVYTKR